MFPLLFILCTIMFSAQAALVSCLSPTMARGPSSSQQLSFRKRFMAAQSDFLTMSLSRKDKADDFMDEDAARKNPTNRLLEIFSSVYRLPSPPTQASRLIESPSFDAEQESEPDFKRISDRIWSNCHLRMGENLSPDTNAHAYTHIDGGAHATEFVGHVHPSGNGRLAGYPSDYDDKTRAMGNAEAETHVVSRGLAYGIAGSINALCFVALMFGSLLFETPAA